MTMNPCVALVVLDDSLALVFLTSYADADWWVDGEVGGRGGGGGVGQLLANIAQLVIVVFTNVRKLVPILHC